MSDTRSREGRPGLKTVSAKVNGCFKESNEYPIKIIWKKHNKCKLHLDLNKSWRSIVIEAQEVKALPLKHESL